MQNLIWSVLYMKTWEELYDECASCEKCELHKTRTNCVFGIGDKNADILFVGEAPGEKEDLSGTPFVGRAGQLLDKFLFAVDIPRESVYIANILKCRPPKNRDPKPDEEDACMDYLREQVRLIRPKMIVCLGRISAQRLISPTYRITKEHGQWVEKGGIWMTAIYHPSALLRDVSKRPETFEDLLAIRAKIQETSAKI